MNLELAIGLLGVLVGVPGALVAWKDFRVPRPQTVGGLGVATPALVGQPLPPPSSVQQAPAGRSAGGPARASVVPLSLPRRFLSALVDTYAAVLIGAFFAGFALAGEPQSSDDGSGVILLGSIVGWLVISWISSRTGRSPGRLLVGGRLVPYDDVQGTVSFGKTLLRSLIAFALNSLFWLSLWFGLSSPERRTLHDQWTATQVIRTR